MLVGIVIDDYKLDILLQKLDSSLHKYTIESGPFAKKTTIVRVETAWPLKLASIVKDADAEARQREISKN